VIEGIPKVTDVHDSAAYTRLSGIYTTQQHIHDSAKAVYAIQACSTVEDINPLFFSVS
jgi:hypothetical protein